MLALLSVIITKSITLANRVGRCHTHFLSCFKILEFLFVHLYVCFCFYLFIWHSGGNYFLAGYLLEGSSPSSLSLNLNSLVDGIASLSLKVS